MENFEERLKNEEYSFLGIALIVRVAISGRRITFERKKVIFLKKF